MRFIPGVALLVCVLAFPALPWQAEVPREVLLLRDVKKRMTENLSHMTNYTCLETITRDNRPAARETGARKAVQFQRVDIVRLEVAEVGGTELLAHPGEQKFEKRSFSELVGGGLIGNGTFSGFAHDVFSSGLAKIQSGGEVTIDGRKLLKFEFQIPQLFSGYRVGTDVGHAVVGYHGSFWIDPETLDAVRLEVFADDVPAYSGLTEVTNRIDYARVRISDNDELLPQSAEVMSTQLSGTTSRNRVVFTHCRAYGVESAISFEEPVNTALDKAAAGTSQVDLPAGLEIAIDLDTPVDSTTARVGQLISGVVAMDVKRKGAVLVPKGAVVSGRLRKLDKHLEGWPFVLVELEFSRMEFEGKRTRFFAVLDKIAAPPGSEPIKKVANADLGGVGTLSVPGNRIQLPKGLRMIWRTFSYEQGPGAGK